MKVVILAGGLGTMLAEETTIRPKPMVEIVGIPILCHWTDMYSLLLSNIIKVKRVRNIKKRVKRCAV